MDEDIYSGIYMSCGCDMGVFDTIILKNTKLSGVFDRLVFTVR